MIISLKGAFRLGTLLFLLTNSVHSQVFNGKFAFKYLRDQCRLGTRSPNSPGHRAMKDFLETFLKKQTGEYIRDDFPFVDEKRALKLALTNFHIVFKGKTKKRVILCAHWDTRPWADRDPDLSKRGFPIPGANDGASGVAVLMVLCNILSAHPPARTIEVIFFDGEDYGMDRDGYWCIGSKHFSRKMDPSLYVYAILIDMIGDKDLKIKKEINSLKSAPLLVKKIWDIAFELNIPCFVDAPGPAVYDDHIPLIQHHVPSVDIIDFEYPYWHTMEDTPDKCSPKSLGAVGRVLLKLLYE